MDTFRSRRSFPKYSRDGFLFPSRESSDSYYIIPARDPGNENSIPSGTGKGDIWSFPKNPGTKISIPSRPGTKNSVPFHSDGTGSRPVPSRPGKSDFFPVPSRPEGFFIIPGISRDNSVPSRELSVPSRISHVIKIFFFYYSQNNTAARLKILDVIFIDFLYRKKLILW